MILRIKLLEYRHNENFHSPECVITTRVKSTREINNAIYWDLESVMMHVTLYGKETIMSPIHPHVRLIDGRLEFQALYSTHALVSIPIGWVVEDNFPKIPSELTKQTNGITTSI